MPSNIPRAREILRSGLNMDRNSMRIAIQCALTHMTRDPYYREAAPVKCHKPTPAMMRQVKHIADTNPDLSQLEIANMFMTNPGRISEILNGLRDPETGEML